MSECRKCGREDGHWLGCPAAEEQPAADVATCARIGCTNPPAVSKGPRPAKYCDDHKTGSKK